MLFLSMTVDTCHFISISMNSDIVVTWRWYKTVKTDSTWVIDIDNRQSTAWGSLYAYFTWGMRMRLVLRPRPVQRPACAQHCTYLPHRNTYGPCQYFPSYTRGLPWIDLFVVVMYRFAGPPRTLEREKTGVNG